MFVKVILLSPPFSELTYSLPGYFPPDFWKKGMRVLVPLGGVKKISLRPGYISAFLAESGLPDGVQCKSVFFPLETSPLLSEELVDLSLSLAQRQAYPPGSVYGRALPQNLRSSKIRLRPRSGLGKPDMELPSLFRQDPSVWANAAADLVSVKAVFTAGTRDEAEREICSLQIDPPWPARPAAVKQIAILDFLHERGSQTRRQLLKALGPAYSPPLRKLIDAGYVSVSVDDETGGDGALPALLSPPPSPAIILNAEQTRAAEELNQAMTSDKPECRLLFGVTGSGKTAVYMNLIQKCLALGKSAFLLAPEVALAYKLYKDAQNAIHNFPVYLHHGYQTSGKRERIFRELAAETRPCLVVGTRSSLFLPLANPACIILDEEHDASYKQDESFAYHAKEAAWFRIGRTNGLLLLASATPDLRSWQAGSAGSLARSRLSRRISDRGLPPMRLLDIGPKAGMSAAGAINSPSDRILAEECERELAACVERGEQAVILLNRRGYAPLIFCVECGHTLRCPNCEIGLAYHKNIGKLLCHYCGYSEPYPSPCRDCGKTNFLPVGEGTEKLAERLESLARQPVLRLDRDNVRRAGKMEEILEDFARQKSPFLVGTQMLSKGHHFPNVTLVLVADGDIGLNMPDYRAAEKTFQLLVQAAGRAGRGEKAGQVIVQTRNRSHYCWNYILNYDYEGFAKAELERRKRRGYPPYTRLAMLRISFPAGSQEGAAALADLAGALRARTRSAGVTMLGPAPAPIPMIRGQKRFQCLFKCKEWKLARELYFFALKYPASQRLKLFLDLDPVNMM